MQDLLADLAIVAACLPSMATKAGLSGQHSASHDEKQALNSSGSIRFITG
jgi:hypothetical protein